MKKDAAMKSSITEDVFGKKAYRASRDSKMYNQYTEKKMTVYTIALRWGVQWHVVKSALEREAKRLGVTLDLKENMLANRKSKLG